MAMIQTLADGGISAHASTMADSQGDVADCSLLRNDHHHFSYNSLARANQMAMSESGTPTMCPECVKHL